MITYRKIDESYFEQYDLIPMLVKVKSKYVLEKINKGLGGFKINEVPVEEYINDLGVYEEAKKYADEFDITNWAFFMAFDDKLPIGAVSIASNTENVNMLDGRDDMSVLWDLRVDDRYKRQGIGTKLLSMAIEWSKSKALKQMKIECQNNNVQACKFYHNHGAVLGKVDEYAYYNDIGAKDEIQFIWYIDL